jgi:hypothetical protein
MHIMRDALHSAMFVVADFGRYTPEIANITKDVVAPYKHVVLSYQDDHSTFNNRNTLLFFQGAIVRKQVRHHHHPNPPSFSQPFSLSWFLSFQVTNCKWPFLKASLLNV